MTDLSELIAKLEAAEGPSRELDAEIAAALEIAPPDFDRARFLPEVRLEFLANEDGSVTIFSVQGNTTRPQRRYAPPAYTASVDAALTLVPRGWCGNLEVGDVGNIEGQRADLWNGELAPDSRETHAEAATPALALCIAALKARVETEGR